MRGTKNDDAFRAAPLSSAAIEVLKAIPRSIKDGRVFYLQGLLLTGARRNELAALRWKSLTIRDKVEGERTIR